MTYAHSTHLRRSQVMPITWTMSVIVGLMACAESRSSNPMVINEFIGGEMMGVEPPLAGTPGGMAGGTELGGTAAGAAAGVMAPVGGTSGGVEMSGTEVGGTEVSGTEVSGTETGGAQVGGAEMGGEPLPPDPRVNEGWIGGPCERDADCTFEGSICLPDEGGYPRGMCTQECTRLCPDRDNMPVTFCIEGVLMSPGACVQRCDYIAFQGTGCRPGYSCTSRARYSEADVTQMVCLPTTQVGETSPVEPPPGSSACIQELSALGVNYEYRGDQRESVSGRPNLSCEVRDAVRVQNPINGVVYRYIESSSASALYGSCELMLAVYQLSALLREYGIVEVGHIGTYNCRVISGTNELSRHGYGDAIDLGSFFTSSGEEYNLVRDWEHNTTSFNTDKARILYEIGQEMHRREIFNIILTPNYDAAHDNHFHVDLTPGGDYHGKMDEGPHHCGNEP